MALQLVVANLLFLASCSSDMDFEENFVLFCVTEQEIKTGGGRGEEEENEA